MADLDRKKIIPELDAIIRSEPVPTEMRVLLAKFLDRINLCEYDVEVDPACSLPVA